MRFPFFCILWTLVKVTNLCFVLEVHVFESVNHLELGKALRKKNIRTIFVLFCFIFFTFESQSFKVFLNLYQMYCYYRPANIRIQSELLWYRCFPIEIGSNLAICIYNCAFLPFLYIINQFIFRSNTNVFILIRSLKFFLIIFTPTLEAAKVDNSLDVVA